MQLVIDIHETVLHVFQCPHRKGEEIILSDESCDF